MRGERGSVTLFVLLFSITALVLASLLVDLGSAINAQERAADLAEQAARAGPTRSTRQTSAAAR